ncbi:MAG TPA: penicillin-binding transpeptidase domain-containing protein [Thermoleophilaceae bacterium]
MALAIGAVVGSFADSSSHKAARSFTQAWARGDYAVMHDLLTDDAQSRYPLKAFRAAYRRAAATATLKRVAPEDPESTTDGEAVVPVLLNTRVFGRVRGRLTLPVDDDRIDWTPNLAFPNVRRGERLRRRSDPPTRATIVSRDGKVLAQGPADARSSPLGELAGSIAGTLSPAESKAARLALYEQGFPRNWPVGQTGLEKAFEDRLAGSPGGELLAGSRVLARSRPRRAHRVRTTIDTRVQEAAVTALAGRLGGVAALDAHTGEMRALAGIAFSAPQPPGSTFKIVTTTAALEAHKVKPSTEFPVQTAALIDGVELQNAGGESCGGTFQNSFAHSCNSVFAPLGVRVGAKRLVEAAERYGWNQPPTVPGEAPSTLPPADEIVTPLEVGSTAIGQGKVLATPLVMASVAQTIAEEGVRTKPTLVPDARAERERVTSRRVANTIERLMVDVVKYGTGTAAAIEGVPVAGKTGTAELEDTRVTPGSDAPPPPQDGSNTDAWFTAYAPADRPRIAVAVMLVRAGAGGATAAPAARLVLDAGLKAR